jgi:hypothetical protein
MLNIATVILKIISRQRVIAYLLGRFKTFRSLYSASKKIQQLIIGSQEKINYENTTFFQDVAIDFALKSLEKDAVFLGLKLPKDIVAEIQTFSQSTFLAQENGLAHFYYSDVQNACLPDGRVTVQGIAIHPLACHAIRQLIDDPVLRTIVEKHLGYSPKVIRPLLRWSFLLELPEEVRMKLGQGNIYHYDVGEFNSVYINFYLSDTDRYSGAHAMIKGSHNRKTLQMLFNHATQSRDFLIKFYGKENEIIIEGERGLGFIQNPYCYHRAIPPLQRERLLLQIQFC